MTAPTDQFVDIAKRSQEAVTTAVRNWADSVQSFAGNLTTGQHQLPDPLSVVDGYFDFAEKVLATQRRFASEWVSASVKAGETVHEQVTKATETVTAQTVNGTEQAAAQATETAREGGLHRPRRAQRHQGLTSAGHLDGPVRHPPGGGRFGVSRAVRLTPRPAP